jgi:hypothetical protein
LKVTTYTYWPNLYFPFTSDGGVPVVVPASGTVEQLVQAVLQADPTVAGMVGSRVYIDTDLQQGFKVSDQYAATVRQVGGSESESGTVQQVTIEIECFGPTVSGALSLAVAARSALVGYSSGQLKRVQLARPGVLRRREGGLPYYDLQVKVWYAI